jgi:acyl-CoA synthetase (AMP-forming)/AMP-acid ligase II
MTITYISKARFDAGEWPAEKTIWQLAEAIVERDPDRITHVFEDERCRVADLIREAMHLSAALAARGFVAGDVVAFQLPNWREALIVNLACCRLGVALAPIVPIYREAELAFMLKDCGARAIFVPGVYRGHDYTAMLGRVQDKLSSLLDVFPVRAEVAGRSSYEDLIQSAPQVDFAPPVDPDAVKLVLYTSGTTGRPKAVLHSHNSRARGVCAVYEEWRQGEGDVMLMASPVTHITGFGSGLELPFLTGMRTVFMERWDAARGVELIDRERATISMGATPFLQELLDAADKAGSRLPSLRCYACGGAAVPPALIRRAWTQLENCRAFRVYGSSEVPLVTKGFFGAEQMDRAAETDGQIRNYEVRIVDDEGKDAPFGIDGEICVRGPSMFLGYLDPKQTIDSSTEDGYFRTGDIGCMSEDRALQITDRKKDLINRGGEKISAKEVEDILYRHAAVAEVAVIAVPHARLGETTCACVVLKPGCTLDFDALNRHVADAGVARQKLPERLEIVEALPKTPSGKVRKDELRRQFSSFATTA